MLKSLFGRFYFFPRESPPVSESPSFHRTLRTALLLADDLSELEREGSSRIRKYLEADLWDRDYLDLCGPATINIGAATMASSPLAPCKPARS
jgi:hypothetical protein